MKIIVRDAVAADTPALRELFLHSRRETFVWVPAGAFQPADFDAQTEGERLRVAEDGSGRLAGFVSVWEPDHFIHHLHVSWPHHRSGVGRALLDRALADAKKAGHRLVILVGDEPYYSRVGFKAVAKGTATMPGPVDYSRLLVAELAEGAFNGVSGAIRPDWSKTK